MKHKLLLAYSWFVRTILFFLPDMPLVMRFRGFLYGLGMAKRGKNIQVTHDAILRDLENMSLGRVFLLVIRHLYSVVESSKLPLRYR